MEPAVVEALVQSNKEDIEKLNKIVIGNGEVGMDETVRKIYTMLETHVNEDKDEEERKRKKRDRIQAGLVVGLVVDSIMIIVALFLI